MHKPEFGQLRSFLGAIASGERHFGVIPPFLKRMASRQLRGTPLAGDFAAAEDALGDLLLRLVEGARSADSRSPAHLVSLDERALAGAIRRRLRQALADTADPRSRLARELRRHVRRALPSIGEAAHSEPATLLVKGRLSSSAVRQAVSWLLHSREPPARTVPALTAALLARHFPADVGLSEAVAEEIHGGEPTPETAAEASHDGEALAARIERDLGPELVPSLVAKRDGRPLREVGPVATAQGRLKRAEARLRRCARGFSRDAAVWAIRGLGGVSRPTRMG